MTTNQNHDNASRRMRFNTCDNGGVALWLSVEHDVLFLVMMKLGVTDFLAFSGVCKSWRSLALLNRRMFMSSRQPMSMWICDHADTNESYCYLQDFEGRKSKTIIPHSGGRSCIGLTCGYLVLYGWETHDYWLVNLITSHELHFPALPSLPNFHLFKGILVFSPSVNECVFVVLHSHSLNLWYSIAGEGVWNRVPTNSRILDLHAFKGKILTLNEGWSVCELRLNPEPKFTLLEIKNSIMRHIMIPLFISSGENLYVIDWSSRNPDNIFELDFGKMKWVSSKEMTIGEYIFIQSAWKYGAVFKPESWAGKTPSKYKIHEYFLETIDKSRKGGLFGVIMWYFPHDCLNVNVID